MSKKLFEHDISRSLVPICDYYYKPPDALAGNSDKVDFLCNFRGRFLAIECKQVPNTTCSMRLFTPNQRRVLEDVGKSGIALALINYGRGYGKDRGAVGVWRVEPRFAWPLSFRFDEAPFEMYPEEAGAWPLLKLLDRMA